MMILPLLHRGLPVSRYYIPADAEKVMKEDPPKLGLRGHGERWERGPEHGMLGAIIERAGYDLNSRDLRERRDARVWVMDTSKEPWRFLWCCEHLRLTEAFIRRLRQLAISSNLDVH